MTHPQSLPELPTATLHEVENANTGERSLSRTSTAYYGSNWREVLPLFTAEQMRAYGQACAEAEREACARVCDEKARRNFPWGSEHSHIYHAQADWAKQCATAIRARKEQK